jgi:hypothetical protein
MGRMVGIKGFSTTNTQSVLRILEKSALEQKEKSLVTASKNARFNL